MVFKEGDKVVIVECEYTIAFNLTKRKGLVVSRLDGYTQVMIEGRGDTHWNMKEDELILDTTLRYYYAI